MNRFNRFGFALVVMLLLSLVPTGLTSGIRSTNAQTVPQFKLDNGETITAPVGELVPWSVSGFPANSWIVIQRLVPGGFPAILKNALTDGAGTAEGLIDLPPAAGSADHVIEARSGAVRDTALFRVVPEGYATLPAWGAPVFPNGFWLPNVQPSALAIASGDTVNFHFAGLNFPETYSLSRWDETGALLPVIATVQASEFGLATVSAQITQTGNYAIVNENSELILLTAVITVGGGANPPVANISRSSASPAEQVSISVGNFLASFTVEYSFDGGGTWLGTALTDGQGDATFMVEIPEMPQGSLTIQLRTGALTGSVSLLIVPWMDTFRQSTTQFWSAFRGLSEPANVRYLIAGQWIEAGWATPTADGQAILAFEILNPPAGTMPIVALVSGIPILFDEVVIQTPGPLPPFAMIAGGDRTVEAGPSGTAFVSLDGSDSFDLDGPLFSFDWADSTGGPYNPIASGNYVTVALAIGVHSIRLTVTDNDDLTSEAFVTITVEEGPPPDVLLSTDRATVSSTVTFEVSGFPGSTNVDVSLARPGRADVALTSFMTDVSGNRIESFVVPAVPGGDYTVEFTAGSVEGSAPLEVAPRISPTPTVAAPGQTISLNLRGFAANDDVLIRWRIGSTFVTVGSARTSSTGSLTNKQIVVPVNAAAGQNTIRVEGTIDQQSNAVNVIIPGVALSTSRSTVNNQIGYSLTNFPPNSYISITWRRLSGGTIDMGTVVADGYGAATGFLTVPATPGGPGQQIIFAAGNVVVNVEFEVAPRVKVTPIPVMAGASMDVSLRGFARGEAVTIRWRPGTSGPWTVIGNGTTSNTGSANIAIIVPNNAFTGTYQLRAETASFNQQTNVVEVNGGLEFAPNEEASPSPTPEETITPEVTPEVTETPTVEPEPTAVPTETPVETPTETPVPVEEPTPTVEPVPTIEETPAP
jgi:hypothetical protein